MPPRRPRRTATGEAMERRLVSRDLGRAWRAIRSVRSFLVVLAVVNAVYAFIYLVNASDARGSARTLLEVMGGVSAVFTVLFGLGAWLIARRPYPWTLAVALLQSLTAVLTVVSPTALLSKGLAVFLALCCWAAVAVIAPAGRLMRKYPELRIARKLRGEKRAGGGDSRRRTPRRTPRRR